MENNQKAYQIFSTFKSKYYEDKSEESTAKDGLKILDIDEEMKIIIQRINKKSKKSTTTRVKALQQMHETLKEKHESYFDSLIRLFVIVYEKIVTSENDVSVLSELQKCLEVFIEKGDKAIKKNFGLIFPYIYFASFELNKEVAGATRANLSKLLKDDTKIAKALFMFKDKYLALIHSIFDNPEQFIKDMGIYDEKEVNEIIYKKLLAMVWWSLARTLQLAKNLSPEEQEQLLQSIFGATLQSPDPLLLKMFSQYKNDYVVRTSLLNFVNILFTGNHTPGIDKAVLKKIVQAVAVNNLDDPNLSFQTFLWKDAFIVRLLECASSLKLDFSSIKKRFLSIVDNHAYGAEQAYYQNLDEALDIFLKEDKKSNESYFEEIIMAHFSAVLKDDLRFEVGAHYKAGFSLLVKQIQRVQSESKYSEEKEGKSKTGMTIESIAKSVLKSLIQLFFVNNNSSQKNLNVLSVNNIKHFPLHLCEFFQECFAAGIHQSFFDAFVSEFRVYVAEVFSNSLSNRNAVANVAILIKYFEKMLVKATDSSNESSLKFYSTVVYIPVKEFTHAYSAKIANLDDSSFPATLKELESLVGFVEDAFEDSFLTAQPIIYSQVAGSQSELESFLSAVQTDYQKLVVLDGIDASLIDPVNKDSFILWINEFLKSLYLFVDYEPIIQSFSSEMGKGFSGKLAQNLWTKVLMFSVEKPLVKKCAELARIYDESDSRNISELISLKSIKTLVFTKQLLKLPNFEFFLVKITQVLLKNNQMQFAVPVWIFSENDTQNSLITVTKQFSEFWKQCNKTELVASDLFKLKLHMSLAPLMPKEHFEESILTIFGLIKRLDPQTSYQTIADFVEDVHGLSEAQFHNAYELLLNDALQFDSENHNLKLTIKQLSQAITENNSHELTEQLHGTFASQFQKLFGKCEQIGWNNQFAVEALRVAMKPLTGVSWQRVFRNAFTDSSAEKASRIAMLTNLACQPSVINNYTSNKKRIFWSSIVYGNIMGYVIDLHSNEHQTFIEIMHAVIDQSMENTYLIVFVKKMLKQFLKDDSIEVSQKSKLINEVIRNFQQKLNTLKNTEDTNKLQSIAFNYKELVSGTPISGIVKYEEWRLWQQIYESDNYCLFVLINQVVNFKIGYGFKGEGNIKETDESAQKEFATSLARLIEQAQKLADSSAVRHIGLSLYLELISIALEKHDEAILAANSETLEKYLIEILGLAETNFTAPFSQNCFYQFLVLIRKLINVLEMFSENFETNVLKKISRYTFFLSTHAKNNQTLQFWTIPPEDFFNEIAETIARFALREISEVSIEEVFQVLEVDINCLKKSAFYLLQQFKKPFEFDRETVETVSRGDLTIDALVPFFPTHMQNILFNLSQSKVDVFTYFLYWTFALRLCNGQTESSRQKFFLFSTLFNDSPKVYNNLLTGIFTFFKNKKLNDREIFNLLDRVDFLAPESNWGDFINEQTKETFGVHLIFLFASLFPKNLRKWIEEEKKLANIAVVFLNYKINQAIFSKEIEKIELTQHEWKTPDFDIFVYKNTKEIAAVYFKDDNRLEVSLKVPDNYPVKLIDVSLSREAKITEAKANKWILMIKRMLTNQNYSIVDALVMWKNNIEKEFEGIDECAICYCIIHTTSKKLPTMPCKTCKKKFHTDCIHKWFQTSQKSECPLCKSQFL